MYSFPPGISIQDIKGYGTSGMTALIPNTREIIKFPVTDQADDRERCNREKEIYQLFQSSPYKRPTSLLQFNGSTEYGILLEYAEQGPVALYLQRLAGRLPTSTLLRWAQEAADALSFVHRNGVFHGDINCTNFFLNGRLELKLGDFTSSLIHSVIPPEDIQEDIRNFGSALYEMAMGHLPFPDLSSSEREDALLAKRYPDVTEITTLRSIILRCWSGEYTNMQDVRKDINRAGLSNLPPTICILMLIRQQANPPHWSQVLQKRSASFFLSMCCRRL
jgi:serine/threonine protein kinase